MPNDLPREDDFQVLAEMPVFHINSQSQFAPHRPISGNLARWFLLRAARRILQAYEGGLKQSTRELFSLAVFLGTGCKLRPGAEV